MWKLRVNEEIKLMRKQEMGNEARAAAEAQFSAEMAAMASQESGKPSYSLAEELEMSRVVSEELNKRKGIEDGLARERRARLEAQKRVSAVRCLPRARGRAWGCRAGRPSLFSAVEPAPVIASPHL